MRTFRMTTTNLNSESADLMAMALRTAHSDASAKVHDRAAIDAAEPFGGPNAHAFAKARR